MTRRVQLRSCRGGCHPSPSRKPLYPAPAGPTPVWTRSSQPATEKKPYRYSFICTVTENSLYWIPYCSCIIIAVMFNFHWWYNFYDWACATHSGVWLPYRRPAQRSVSTCPRPKKTCLAYGCPAMGYEFIRPLCLNLNRSKTQRI